MAWSGARATKARTGENVTPPALDAWSKVGMIEASHFDADTAYAAIDRHRLDDRKPYIYRTHDGGKTWKAIVDGIRDGDFVNAVREDPERSGLLYAATELGMYVSFDDGDHWQSLQMNLPRTSVRDIDVHGDDLVIATHGRGFWIMDDVSAAAADRPGDALQATRLFAPSTAIRVRRRRIHRHAAAEGRAAGENPPVGARIDYVLATTPAHAGRAGDPRRERTSWCGAIRAAIAPPNHDPRRRPAPRRNGSGALDAGDDARACTASSGRCAIRHLPALADGNAYADGAWAPPGRYTVALTVDGQTWTQPLTVAPDPRVHLATDAYAQQFAFARQVEAAQARLAPVEAEAKRLHAALRVARATAGAAAGRSGWTRSTTR